MKIKYYPPKPIYLPPESELFKKLDNNTLWLCEPKINGIRCLVFNKQLWSRHGNIITTPLSEIRDLLLPDCDFDCELVYKNGIKEIYIFDIMRYKNQDIYNLPLIERKKILLSIPEIQSKILSWVFTDKIKFYYNCLAKGYEGVVLKRINSVYKRFPVESKEISDWIKIKPKK